MNAQELITEHLDIWTTAQQPQKSGGRGRGKKTNGQSLYGIKKLRELILDLAVRGKLVEQNPADEPASVLLKKIATEKAQLIKEKKIKKQKKLPEITEEEKPFALPNGWEWVRLGDFSQIKGGKRLPKGHSFSMVETPFIYVQVTNMKNGTIIKNNLKYLSEETQSEIFRYTISKDDLYITIAGTIGDVGIVPEYFDGMNLTENAAKIIFCEVDKLWLQKTLSSQTVQQQFTEKTNQLAQPKLALHRVASSCLALPPLSEQHRIVAKVDELMTLCDQLEQQQTTSNTTHQTLLQTLLATLIKSADHETATTAWERIATHFDVLFTTEQSIDQLQQTILQLAVMGKLVPQNPEDLPAPRPGKWFVYVLECEDGSLYKGHTRDILGRWKQHARGRGAEWTKKHPPTRLVHWEEFDTRENAVTREQELKSGFGRKWLHREIKAGRTRQAGEPASLLLEKIAKEKARLIKEGKIKKQKKLSEITEEEKPFALPEGWEWTRMDDLALSSEAGWSPKCESISRRKGKWGVLKVSSVTWGRYNPNENKELPEDLTPRPQFEVTPKDFLISRANTADLVARSVIVPDETPSRLMMSDKIIRLRFSLVVNIEFVNIVNLSPAARLYYAKVAGGTSNSMKNVSRSKIRKLVIPLPPLAEQRRIVAKVDELMALCDQLKTNLYNNQTTKLQLADTIVNLNGDHS